MQRAHHSSRRFAVLAASLGIACLVASPSCRTDCLSALECDRGEMCELDGRCVVLPGTTPLSTVYPGRTFEVLAVFPAPDSDGAPSRGPIVVLFTRPVDPKTLSTASLRLRDGRGEDVAASFDVLAEPPGALLVPSAPLASGAGFTVSVTSALRDLDGNALRPEVSWAFRTAPATAP